MAVVIVATMLAGSLGASGCSSPTTAALEVERSEIALEEARVELGAARGYIVNPPGAISLDLRMGRRTRIAGTFRTRSFAADGTPTPWVEQEFEELREIVGEDAIDGRIYARERYRFDPAGDEGPPELDSWYRQDRSGYFTYAGDGDLPARTPPPRTGQAESETTLLQYPAHRNESWVSGFQARFRFTVEALEWLDTPAGRYLAARVRMAAVSGDPDRESVRWYAEPGLVREYERSVSRRTVPVNAILSESERTSEIVEYTPGQELPAP